MKLNTVLTILVVATAVTVAIPVLRPSWDDYQSTVRDCVETKPESRAPAQNDHCKRRGWVNVIPGVI